MYLPWVLCLFNMIIRGNGLSELMGILVGHLYFFLMFKYPQDFGGRSFLTTPQVGVVGLNVFRSLFHILNSVQLFPTFYDTRTFEKTFLFLLDFVQVATESARRRFGIRAGAVL